MGLVKQGATVFTITHKQYEHAGSTQNDRLLEFIGPALQTPPSLLLPCSCTSDFSVFLASWRQDPSVVRCLVVALASPTCCYAQRWTEGPETHEGLRVSAGQRSRGPKGLAGSPPPTQPTVSPEAGRWFSVGESQSHSLQLLEPAGCVSSQLYAGRGTFTP